MKDEVIEKRSFTTVGGEEYRIIQPTANDIKEADWQYSVVYTRSLADGIATSAEMMDILRRRGIIGPEFEQRAEELVTTLNEKIWALELADSIEEKRTLAVEVSEARNDVIMWNQRMNGPMGNTCENLADDARLDYLVSCMIADMDGNKLWDKYEDYLEAPRELILEARREITLYLQGLESDFFERTPEALALKEVEDDVLKKAEAAAKAAEAIEKEEEILSKEKTEEKPKKKPRKTANKKKTTAKKKDKNKSDE
jgi:hypothetical protein